MVKNNQSVDVIWSMKNHRFETDKITWGWLYISLTTQFVILASSAYIEGYITSVPATLIYCFLNAKNTTVLHKDINMT